MPSEGLSNDLRLHGYGQDSHQQNAAAPHFCTFCRCRFPVAPPDLDEMMASAQRVVTELREARELIQRLKAEVA